MKLRRIAPLAAAGVISAALAPAAPQGPRADLLEGTWNLEVLTQGCKDMTDAHRGELWIFGADGSFDRVRRGADGTLSHEPGRYVVQYHESEINLILDSGERGRRSEAYPILALDESRLELLSPTQVRQGVVIQQERFAAFFHS